MTSTLTSAKDLAACSRRLRARADAILGVVWYVPERERGFAHLGLDGPESMLGGRAACMGAVPGRVAAAAFGALEPTMVSRAVDGAWEKTSPEQLLAARLSASRQLLKQVVEPGSYDDVSRVLDALRPALELAETAGHLVFSGLRSLEWPSDPVGDLWRACDMVREHRGDSHVNAWTAAGFDPVEINVLSEAWRNLPADSVTVHQMGWRRTKALAARSRLVDRGWLDCAGAITAEGRRARDKVEADTDVQERALVEALGDRIEMVLALTEPWARGCLELAARWFETYSTMRGLRP